MRKRKVPRIVHYFYALQNNFPNMSSEECIERVRILCRISKSDCDFLIKSFLSDFSEEKRKLMKEIPPIVNRRIKEYISKNGLNYETIS